MLGVWAWCIASTLNENLFNALKALGFGIAGESSGITVEGCIANNCEGSNVGLGGLSFISMVRSVNKINQREGK